MLPHIERKCVHMIKYMSAEQTGLINFYSTTFFVLRNNMRLSAAQRVVNQYERRSLLEVKN